MKLEDPSDPNSAVLKDAGITVPEGSTMLVSLGAELDVGRFEVEGQGLLEILGTDDKNSAGAVQHNDRWRGA